MLGPARSDDGTCHAGREGAEAERKLVPSQVARVELHRLHPLPVRRVVSLRPRTVPPDSVGQGTLGDDPDALVLGGGKDVLDTALVEEVDRALDAAEGARTNRPRERFALPRVGGHDDLALPARAIERA